MITVIVRMGVAREQSRETQVGFPNSLRLAGFVSRAPIQILNKDDAWVSVNVRVYAAKQCSQIWSNCNRSKVQINSGGSIRTVLYAGRTQAHKERNSKNALLSLCHITSLMHTTFFAKRCTELGIAGDKPCGLPFPNSAGSGMTHDHARVALLSLVDRHPPQTGGATCPDNCYLVAMVHVGTCVCETPFVGQTQWHPRSHRP